MSAGANCGAWLQARDRTNRYRPPHRGPTL